MSQYIRKDGKVIHLQTKLTREQKQAVGLLSIGTLLEYFDLMLYVHMAVLLNELFFPQSDPHTTKILSAVGFCTAFIFRPFGALLFGWIGDTIGRKSTVVITTLMMASVCFIMAMLPTYAQIGIYASIGITLCRVFQGMSSMGEIVGAGIYLTESIKPPVQYMAVALIFLSTGFGELLALGIASLVTTSDFNWRFAFLFGMVIAVVGGIARTYLRESPDFTNAKRQLEITLEKVGIDKSKLEHHPAIKQKVSKRTSLAYFLIECIWPVYFYIAYVHCGNILEESFGYNAGQVINHNFVLLICELSSAAFLVYLSHKIYPLKILTAQWFMLVIFLIACPLIFLNISTPFHLFLLQAFFTCVAPTTLTANSIFYSHFPIFKRFTYSTVIFASTRALMYVISSFGLVYLTKYFGYYGLLFILIPVTIGYAFGLRHFWMLEKDKGNIPNEDIKLIPSPPLFV